MCRNVRSHIAAVFTEAGFLLGTFQTLLVGADRMEVILVGNRAIRNRASEEITRFAQRLNIPVTNTLMGRGVLDYQDARSLWTVLPLFSTTVAIGWLSGSRSLPIASRLILSRCC